MYEKREGCMCDGQEGEGGGEAQINILYCTVLKYAISTFLTVLKYATSTYVCRMFVNYTACLLTILHVC